MRESAAKLPAEPDHLETALAEAEAYRLRNGETENIPTLRRSPRPARKATVAAG